MDEISSHIINTRDVYKNEIWKKHFQELIQFIQKHKRFPIYYFKRSLAERKIGHWVKVQKEYYYSGRLDIDKYRKLMTIGGWKWCCYERWNETFNNLRKFIENNGYYPRHSLANSEEQYLYNWVNQQRYKFNDDRLEKKRVRKLEELPKWTW